ncbi:hypothetical protein [Luteibacter sp.]|uniref:hypothetical protein n=1 Tax=Luteibacter sp. TaxID=1886636 RepID=UPI003F7F29E7
MDSSEAGFLLGAVPGMVFGLRNMLDQVRLILRAKKVVREHGERFAHVDDLSAMNGFAFKSSPLVQPTDGPAVREAKEMILARESKFLLNHLKALFFVFGGSAIGAFLGALSKLLSTHT